VTVLAVTTAHEFAHGLTCKYFGGEVREIGFLLLYFQPAFYCNISDAWLFPKKSQRLWVTFAGAYLEIFVWSLATLIWRVTEPDTWINFMALIVMATSGVKTFFNMNPLIKLDGYYLLSDYLDVPNLRQRSMGYLKSLMKRLWRWSIADGPKATPRERRIYVAYGVLAMIYSTWILSLVATEFGGYLVEQYQGAGFVVFASLLGVAFQRPLGSAARTLRGAVATFPAKRSMPPIRPRVVRAAAVLLGAAVLFFGRMELKVSGEFKVLPARNADVRVMVEGLIEQVFVKEGDRVRAGDMLARLSDRDYRAELGKVDAEIAEKQAALTMLRAGPRREEIDLARGEVQTALTRQQHARKRFDEAGRIRGTRLSKSEAAVKVARERLEYRRAEMRRVHELFASGLVSQKQLEESKHEAAVAEKELEAAQAEFQIVSADDLAETGQEAAVSQMQADEAASRLKLLLAGSRPEALEATEAAIARLEAQRRFLADQVRLTAIVSPTSGVVGLVTMPKPGGEPGAVTTTRLEEKVGEHVNRGDVIVKVFEIDHTTPEVTVSEKEIADVRPGERVVLKARAYPGEGLTGRVKAIAPAAIDDSYLARKVFRVTIEMDGNSELLKPEMTGTAKIFCGSRSIWNLVTRRIERYLRVEFCSWF
jgi:putative peptide zinc metalloprotease protein